LVGANRVGTESNLSLFNINNNANQFKKQMKELKEYHYTYYSYEEWGRGYFGSRSCYCTPEEDVNYLGSYTDKNFNPTHKIILKDDYSARSEAMVDEIILHDYYDVANNPHFANKAKLTSTGFCVTGEDAVRNGKMGGRMGGLISYENKLGFHSFNKEERKKYSSKGGKNADRDKRKNKTGFYGMSTEQKIEAGKKGGLKNKENNTGFFSMSPEKKSERSRKNGNKIKELGLGIHGRTKEQMTEDGRKGAKRQQELGIGIFSPGKSSEGGKKVCSQKWQCTETGFITNPGNLTKYQRARGIDTSKRIRIV
jgi:hypothetical protein